MKRIVRLLVCAVIAGSAVLGTPAPAGAVCTQSHSGGCDPCPSSDPELPVGDLALLN